MQEAGSAMEPNTSTIIVGVMSVLATYISTLIVDRLGRKILLLCSIVVMGICTLLIAVDRCLLLHEIQRLRRFGYRVHPACVHVHVHHPVLARFRTHPVDVDRRNLPGTN